MHKVSLRIPPHHETTTRAFVRRLHEHHHFNMDKSSPFLGQFLI